MRETFETIGRHVSRWEKTSESGPQIALRRFLAETPVVIFGLLFSVLPRLVMLAIFPFARAFFSKIERRHPKWCRKFKFKFMRAVLRAPKGPSIARQSRSDPWGESRVRDGEALAPWVIRFANVIEKRILERGPNMPRGDVFLQIRVAMQGYLRLCALECLVPWMDREWRQARRLARPNPSSGPFVSNMVWEGWIFESLEGGERHCSRLLAWMNRRGGNSMFKRFHCLSISSRSNNYSKSFASTWIVLAQRVFWQPMALSRDVARNRLSAIAEARSLGRAMLSGTPCDPDRWQEGVLVAESASLRWLVAGGFGFELQEDLDRKVLEETEALALKLLMLAISGLSPGERALATLCWLEGSWLSIKSAGWGDGRSEITSIGSNEAFMAFLHQREEPLSGSPTAIAVARSIIEAEAFGEMSKRLSTVSIKSLARIAHGHQWEMPFFLGLRPWRVTLSVARVFGQSRLGGQCALSSKSDLRSMSLGRFIEFAFANGVWAPADGSMRDALLGAFADFKNLSGVVKFFGAAFLAELDSLIEREVIKSAVGATISAPKRRAARI